ncbi:MAG: YdeI/OmpD-associated family protein [Acidimicrobiia bacterium]|nr:YdeI/OmpD-associated family protein [Acidimicrobiia bacterium]
MPASQSDRFEKLEVTSATELGDWLETNHTRQEAVWLVTFKKHVPDAYVSTQEALDELLCFGWVDGVRRKLDDDRTMQLISPRRTQYWAKSYKERAARLIAEGRMRPAGLASIERSKANGSWDFMNDVDALIQPTDLDEVLSQHPPAAAEFAAFPVSYRRNALRWIKLAKTDQTRRKRLEQLAQLAAEGGRVKNL